MSIEEAGPRAKKADYDDVALRAIYRKIDWRVLPFLLVCYVFAYLDRVNVGFARQALQNDIGLGDAAFGLGAGIFFLGYVLFEIPSNLLMTRVGARLTFGRILILWGLTSAALAFVRDEMSFYALRFLLGVFEAGFGPGLIYYLTNWYGGTRTGRVLSFVLLAGPVGAAIGGPVSSAIMLSFSGVFGFAGWQWLFLVEGLPCVLLGVLAYFYLVDSPQDARWLTDEERGLLAREVGQGRGAHGGFGAIVKDPSIYALAIGYFCLISGIYAIGFWLPTFLQDLGVTDVMTLGFYAAVPYLAAVLMMIVAAWSSDRLRERRWHASGLALASAVALLTATFAGTLTAAFIAIVCATAFVWASYAVFWAVPSEKLQGTAAAGGIALINTIGLLGGFVSPLWLGQARAWTGSLEVGLWGVAFTIALGALIIALTVGLRRWRPA